jgi:hypothetical protein
MLRMYPSSVVTLWVSTGYPFLITISGCNMHQRSLIMHCRNIIWFSVMLETCIQLLIEIFPTFGR